MNLMLKWSYVMNTKGIITHSTLQSVCALRDFQPERAAVCSGKTSINILHPTNITKTDSIKQIGACPEIFQKIFFMSFIFSICISYNLCLYIFSYYISFALV